MTTDTNRTARQIINTYGLRPEIEEDFRQMKDFRKLEDFKSTKYKPLYHIKNKAQAVIRKSLQRLCDLIL